MDFPALSKLQHAEGAQNNHAAVFNVCSSAHKSLEMQHLSNIKHLRGCPRCQTPQDAWDVLGSGQQFQHELGISQHR